MTRNRRSMTLARVAASAGVSVATVSKVLNGRSDVGAATRARVESLLTAHEYVARRAESPGAGTSPHTVEVVFHGAMSAYATAILEGVIEAGDERGVSVSVSLRSRGQSSPAALRPAAWAREFVDRGRRAVIVVVDDSQHNDLGALDRAGVPLVVISPLSRPRKKSASVGTTNFFGGLAATQHLLDLGHRWVAYLGCDPSSAHNQGSHSGIPGRVRSELPEILSTAIFAFLVAWNDYLVALVFLKSSNIFTLPVGLQSFFQQNATDWGSVMALSVVMLLPPTILFALLNKYFSVGGIGGSLAGR